MIIKRGNSYCKRCGELKLTEHGTVNRYASHCAACNLEDKRRAIRSGIASRVVFRGRTYGLFDRAEARKE